MLQDNCPTGCPCDFYECEDSSLTTESALTSTTSVELTTRTSTITTSDRTSTKPVTTTTTTLTLKSILVLNADNEPVLLDSNG